MTPELEKSVLERLIRVQDALYTVNRKHPALVDLDGVILDLGYQPNGKIERKKND